MVNLNSDQICTCKVADANSVRLHGRMTTKITMSQHLVNPEVLLLDEVTSALDEENSQIIHSIISKLNKENNVTILWITHDRNEYLTSNRRLFIEDGLLKEDTHE